MNELYKGYIETKDKKSAEKLKGRTSWKTLEEVQNCDGYAGMLAEDTILIDLDDSEQAEILMKIVEDLQMFCKVICTTRGKHFLFKNTNGLVTKNYTHVTLAVGLTADIKLGSKCSYEVLKTDGEERFCEWDIEDGEEYGEVPKWLIPVGKVNTDFLSMDEGDGRNDALFSYILKLQSSGLTKEECRECIRLMNKYILKKPLDEDEVETILRDDSFQKDIFYVNGSFEFDKFAEFIRANNRIIKVNGQLHIYEDGVYVKDSKSIEAVMIRIIPNLRKTQRTEVLSYLELICKETPVSDPRYIAFTNGIYDIVTDELLPFSQELVIINRIPWDYNPTAYSEIMDKTLWKLACGDQSVRALLEECVGSCFYRANQLGGGKAFILTGDKANGKSTFLDCVKAVLGRENISALDLNEMGDRFSTAMMFGKFANIGDDIGDDFLQGSQVAIFKKIVTGNMIKAEFKGQDPFDFVPYVKLLFSANSIPRMKDKTGAVLRRLIIIPFSARFSKADPDYDPFIIYKLTAEESLQYLIKIGLEGLKRVLAEGYTESDKVEKELEEYREENNPLVGFLKEWGDCIENESTLEVFRRYQIYCQENNQTPMSRVVFTKVVNKMVGFTTVLKKIAGKPTRIFIKEV